MTRAEAAGLAGVSASRTGRLMISRDLTAEEAARHVIRRRAGEVVSRAGRPPAARDAAAAAIREAPGATAGEIADRLPGSTYDSARAALRQLHALGLARRTGSGRRGDPYRYEPTRGDER